MESILASVKKYIGIDPEQTDFDPDIIMHINSILTLNVRQLGVGPEEGFVITGDFETWKNFLSNNILLESVKTYVGIKVKLIFDPPLSQAHITALEQQAKELEWRISISV